MKCWASPAGDDLKDLTHGTAHLIHGSSEGRFTIPYAPGGMSKADLRGVHLGYIDLGEALRRYDPATMRNGLDRMSDGEEVYFIDTPSAGLWATEERLRARSDALPETAGVLEISGPPSRRHEPLERDFGR